MTLFHSDLNFGYYFPTLDIGYLSYYFDHSFLTLDVYTSGRLDYFNLRTKAWNQIICQQFPIMQNHREIRLIYENRL